MIGGVIFFKGRKKRREERDAREAWYASGRDRYSQSPPLNTSPYAPPPHAIPQSPTQKNPAVYGNNVNNSSSTPRPIMAPLGPDAYAREEAPPAYASLRPQNGALGYERQDLNGVPPQPQPQYQEGYGEARDRKRGVFHR